MRRTTRFIDSAVALVIGLGVFMSCSSDDPTVPPVDTCDEQNPGGFSISNPEAGRVYVWGGNGLAGAGEMGDAPGYTNLYWPIDVGFDPAGKPIVLDWENHRVLALDANGKFEKIIGNIFGQPADGPALQANLNHPTHIAFSPDGSKLILSAWHNSIVMEMDMTTGWIRRTCGTGGRCYNLKTVPDSTCLDLPVCTQFHPVTGELYIGDQANQLIRKVNAAGQVEIVAGTAPVSNGPGSWIYQIGYAGDGGPATSAKLNLERGQMTDPAGKFSFDTYGNMYIADTNNNAVRIVRLDGTIDTFAGLGPTAAGYSGDGGAATAARLNKPRDVVADIDGTIFIADTGNHVIRMVDPSGIISTVVGVFRKPVAPNPAVDPISACALQSEQGAPALGVHLTAPRGIELDADGNLWIADTLNNVIRIYYR